MGSYRTVSCRRGLAKTDADAVRALGMEGGNPLVMPGPDFPRLPVRRIEFPVRARTELLATGSKSPGNQGSRLGSRGQISRISLYFPYVSGNRRQRLVRLRLPPPPLSLRLPRLSPDIRIEIEKIPRFRRVLAIRLFRFRTGDGGFGGQSAPLCGFISVAHSGGSDWGSGELWAWQLRPVSANFSFQQATSRNTEALHDRLEA